MGFFSPAAAKPVIADASEINRRFKFIRVRQVSIMLLGYALYHILTHHHYKRGTRQFWLIICIALMGFIGPILYFAFGREEA